MVTVASGGEAGKAEGRPVFEFAGWAPGGKELKSNKGGSRATIAITVLVKDPHHSGPARIHYAQVGDGLSAGQKLSAVSAAGSITNLTESAMIRSNEHGDWLSQRREDFEGFQPISGAPGGIFSLKGQGVTTSRDVWAYASDPADLVENVNRMTAAYNEGLHRGKPMDAIPASEVNWSRKLRKMYTACQALPTPTLGAIRSARYRPFMKQHLYFAPHVVEVASQTDRLFPPGHENFGFAITGAASHFDFCAVAADGVPDFHLLDTGQFFARWRYQSVEPADGMLALEAGEGEGGVVTAGLRRIDNVTDEALHHFKGGYGASFTKDDVYFYVYGLLHSTDYRETYAADLKRSLPRIPLVADATPFVEAGRRLSELHLGYENVAPFAVEGLATDLKPDAPYEYFRVEKMKFAKVRDPETKKLVVDRSTIVYNGHITLSGIPEEAYRYMLGSRSAIEWIMDRYQVKTDKASGIVNDPNDWSREVEDPRYIIDLLARIVTVSLETMKIVDALPPLEIREQQ